MILTTAGEALECVLALLLPENDSRFGQVVRRKLHRNFVTGNDTDEMLAHFPGDVGEHVALAGQINAKHGAGKHLGHGPFHHDLFLFRHRCKLYPRIGQAQYRQAPRLLKIFERNARQIFAEFLSFPPRTSLAMFVDGCEPIPIRRRPNETGWRLRKRIFLKKRNDLRFAV
jgi:hypothetical protein